MKAEGGDEVMSLLWRLEAGIKEELYDGKEALITSIELRREQN